MCGIFGIWHQDGRPVDLPAVQRAVTTLRHRGPDDEGYLLVNVQIGRVVPCGGKDTDPRLGLPQIEEFSNGHFDLVLSHRHLSIIGPSVADHQPVSSIDGHNWIVYDGEIYNCLELRQELADLGHTFGTDSDTEVILAAYQQWGPRCLHRFNGRWAFALWDGAKRCLFCARDRFGIRPFYYDWNGHTLAFASEIKSLLARPGQTRKPNDAAVYTYLVRGGIDESADTFFDDIRRLLPGHYLLLSAEGNLQDVTWYELLSSEPIQVDDETAVDTFRSLFQDAVRLRMQGDAPLGALLSGGIDSSAIVGMAGQLVKSGLPVPGMDCLMTFTAGYEDERFDERRFAQAVAKHAGAHAHYVFPDGQQVLWDDLPRLLQAQDEPFCSTSVYAQWKVAQAAHERGLQVLLDGQGADEILAGYLGYFVPYVAELVAHGRLGTALRELRSIRALHANTSVASIKLLTSRALVAQLPIGLQSRIREVRRRVVTTSATMRVLDAAFAQRFGAPARKPVTERVRSLNVSMRDSLVRGSIPEELRYLGHNLAAFSLESRQPFLDHRLVEYLFTLGSSFKIRDGWTKWVLRVAMSDVLPDEVCWRRDKVGFATPELVWLKANEARSRAMFSHGQVASSEYLNPKRVCDVLHETLFNRSEIGTSEVWRWINLEMWLRI